MSARTRGDIAFLADLMVTELTKRIVDAPGDRAVLRRMVGHPPTHTSARPVHGVIYNCLKGPHGEPFDLPDGPAQEWAFYSVASLIAAQPREARDDNGTAEPVEQDDADPVQEAHESPDKVASPSPNEALEPDPEPASGAGRVRRGRATRLNLGMSLAQGVQAGALNADTTESRLHRLCRLDLNGIHKRLPAVIRQARSRQVPVDWVVLIQDLARWDTERDLVAKQWLQAYHRTRNRDLYLQEKERASADAASTNDEGQ